MTHEKCSNPGPAVSLVISHRLNDDGSDDDDVRGVYVVGCGECLNPAEAIALLRAQVDAITAADTDTDAVVVEVSAL